VSIFWSILDVAFTVAFVVLIPLVIWQTIEQRRLRKNLEGMEPAEVVESVRMMVKMMVPSMTKALAALQQVEHSRR
jgi:hypothetical protein